MEIYKYICVFIIFMIENVAGSVRSLNKLCKGNSTDCRSLIKNASAGGCYMYRNAECKSFNFERWAKKPLSNLTSEVDSPFDATVVMYRRDTRPGYNVTVTYSSADINGFAMKLVSLDGNFNSCRIFDFRNFSQTVFKLPFSLYYDCYDKLDYGVATELYMLFVRILPNNNQLVYQMNVPKMKANEISCHSETLIMALVEALVHNKIAIKFQKLPKKFNIQQYEVRWSIANTSGFSETKIINVNPSDDKKMVSVMFENLNRGRYNVSVEPLHKGKEKCTVTWIPLTIPNELPNFAVIGWFVGIILLVLLVLGVTYYTVNKKLKSIVTSSIRRTILIAYHPDNDELVDVVRRIGAYLENFIPAIIFVDLNIGNQCITDWIRESYDSADIVMIILSEGILTGAMNMTVPLPDGSLFWRICNHVYNEITSEESQSKIHIKVHFGHFDPNDTPQRLKLVEFGPTYKLMDDFKKVFCRIKGVNTFWSVLFQLPDTERESISAAINNMNENNYENFS